MLITVTTTSEQFFNFEVSSDTELAALKSLCSAESGLPINQISISFNGKPLKDDKKNLGAYKIHNGDMLLMEILSKPTTPAANRPPFIDFGSMMLPTPSSSSSLPSLPEPPNPSDLEDPVALRRILLNSPHDLALLKERNPPLAEALLSGNIEKFTQVLREQQNERRRRDDEKFQLARADPFDSNAQRRIAEEIRLKNIESNMETAMEYSPESFGQVCMLYIDCYVNQHPVKAFVDSGAQMTIMSEECAERCNIMRLVDTRWKGVAKGVGVQVIIGRVHLCQVQIGPTFLQCNLSILKDQPMDMLLGLDMLKRHQCIIDLKMNRLVIGTTQTFTPFLSEGDLPQHARLNRPQSDQDDEEQLMLEAVVTSQKDMEKA